MCLCLVALSCSRCDVIKLVNPTLQIRRIGRRSAVALWSPMRPQLPPMRRCQMSDINIGLTLPPMALIVFHFGTPLHLPAILLKASLTSSWERSTTSNGDWWCYTTAGHQSSVFVNGVVWTTQVGWGSMYHYDITDQVVFIGPGADFSTTWIHWFAIAICYHDSQCITHSRPGARLTQHAIVTPLLKNRVLTPWTSRTTAPCPILVSCLKSQNKMRPFGSMSTSLPMTYFCIFNLHIRSGTQQRQPCYVCGQTFWWVSYRYANF